jgi:hypothetical protein
VLTVDFREPLADPSHTDGWYHRQLDLFDRSGVGRDHGAWAELQYQAGRAYDLTS